MTTRAQLDSVMRIAAQMIEREQGDLAQQLLMTFAGEAKPDAPEPAEPSPNDPNKGRTRKQIADAARIARKRQEEKMSRDTHATNATCRATSQDATNDVASNVASNVAPLARAVVSNSSLKTLGISRGFEREEDENQSSEEQFRTRDARATNATVVKIVAARQIEARDMSRRMSQSPESLMWAVWKQLTGAAGQGASHMQRLRDAADALEPIALDRGVPIPVVFQEAAARFWGDPGVREKRLGLVVLCSQLELWTREAPMKRGPVAAIPNDQFDASGDDFAHIEARHG